MPHILRHILQILEIRRPPGLGLYVRLDVPGEVRERLALRGEIRERL